MLETLEWPQPPIKSSCERQLTAGRRLSQIPRQRPSPRSQGVDSLGDLRVFDQGRSVVRFAASVDHQRAATAPVLLPCDCANAVHIGSWVTARKNNPQ